MTSTFRTAVVTGASSILGMACADYLANEGYDLILIDRNRGRLNAQADELTTRTRRAVEVCAADLRCVAQLSLLAEKIRQDASIALLVRIDDPRTRVPHEDARCHDALTRAAADLGRQCGGGCIYRAAVTVIATRR